ncbi:Putative ribonuclease H protein At1g65750 [Linum perenne]
MDSKLSGWKRESLSLAGRVTLATAVLNAIPAYSMQTMILPGHICDLMDQRIRSFVWGSEEGRRKIHLVKWETVCKPKSLGGLGLRSAHYFNQAFILKLAWGILKSPNELWAELLLTKYLKPTPGGLVPRATKRLSSLWRGIRDVWPVLNDGLQWSIRDGKSTSFWMDKWLDNGQRLCDLAIQQDYVNRNEKVDAFCTIDGNWDFDRLMVVLPQPVVDSIAGMIPPKENLGADTPVWGLEGVGRYSVKSGYLLLTDMRDGIGTTGSKWKSIWDWPGPNKIRHFMWLVAHNRLLTNKERKRRHLTDNDTCSCCGTMVETIDHILRSCPIANEVWRKIAPINLFPSFFNTNFDVWWNDNMKNSSWKVQFGVTCWTLWRSRNERVFQNTQLCPDSMSRQIQFWNQTVTKSLEEVAQIRSLNPRVRETREISWQPADSPWYTLNTDGSRSIHGMATAGGAVRNNHGDMIKAFSMNMGGCSITRAEIRGIIEGMKLAWSHGLRKIEVQTDSLCAIQILQMTANDDHQHAGLVCIFKDMIQWDWEVSIRHIYREGNFLADSLAAKGHSLSFGTHLVEAL